MSIWNGSRDGQHTGIMASRLCQKTMMAGARPDQAFSAALLFTARQRVVAFTV